MSSRDDLDRLRTVGGVGRGQVGGGPARGRSKFFWRVSTLKPMSSIFLWTSEALFRRAFRRMALVSLNARSCAFAIWASYSFNPNFTFSPLFFVSHISCSCAVARTASCFVPSHVPGGTSSLGRRAGWMEMVIFVLREMVRYGGDRTDYIISIYK